jgi:hypothetical protein
VSGARRWLNQIGGPNALSIWSWLITLPIGLIVSNITTSPSTADWNPLLWAAVLVAVQVLLGGLMWIAAVTLLPHRTRSSRPVLALAVFATLGLIRVGLLEVLDPLFGPQGSDLESRVLTNVVGGTILLALIAIVVDDYRTHSEIAGQLRRAEASLQWLADQESETLRAADLDELALVRSQVEAQLRDGDSGAEHIRQISESIVRTRSHYLAETPGLDIPAHAADPRSGREIARSVIRGLSWPNPIALALLTEVLALASVATSWSWSVAIANAVIAGLLIVAATTIARRFIPLPRATWARPVVIALGMALLALGVSALSSILVSAITAPFQPALGIAATLLVVVGLGISVWTSVTRDRQRQREVMMTAVSDEARELERIHGEVARRRTAAAEFLHGPIQGQLVASALKGDSNEEALEAVEKRFAQYSASSATWDAQEQVAELISAWAGVMSIKVTCSADTWDRLRRTPLTSRLLVDTLSEALTNSVRHGTVADVDVAIATDEIEDHVRVSLTVTSLGTLTRGTGHGTGLARLMDRGADITLSQVGDHVMMRALL